MANEKNFKEQKTLHVAFSVAEWGILSERNPDDFYKKMVEMIKNPAITIIDNLAPNIVSIYVESGVGGRLSISDVISVEKISCPPPEEVGVFKRLIRHLWWPRGLAGYTLRIKAKNGISVDMPFDKLTRWFVDNLRTAVYGADDEYILDLDV